MSLGWIGGDGGEDRARYAGEWGATSILDAAAAAKANDGIGSSEFAIGSGEGLSEARVLIVPTACPGAWLTA